MATGRLPDPNTAPLTAKGDLYTYSTVPARLAVGSNGDTLVADSSATTGLRWQGNFAAGKNKIINGDMGVWQRGTSITLSSGANGAYGPDRFIFEAYGSSTAATVTRQTFTPGTAPVAGYEGQYFARLTNFATATAWQIRQRIENVQTFAGQTVTFSFWAKASTSLTGITYEMIQNFGSGGSTAVVTALASGQTISTSWTRYSTTIAVPSISGKTIGTSSYLEFNFYQGSGATNSSTVDTWGWQVEAGNTATAFQTATGTLAGELAACQRYYWRFYSSGGGNIAYGRFAIGQMHSATSGQAFIPFPVSMRIAPTALEQTGTAGNYAILNSVGGIVGLTGVPAHDLGSSFGASVQLSFSSSSTAAGQALQLLSNNNATSYLAWSAEL